MRIKDILFESEDFYDKFLKQCISNDKFNYHQKMLHVYTEKLIRGVYPYDNVISIEINSEYRGPKKFVIWIKIFEQKRPVIGAFITIENDYSSISYGHGSAAILKQKDESRSDMISNWGQKNLHVLSGFLNETR